MKCSSEEEHCAITVPLAIFRDSNGMNPKS
jgi:hypothetical protein